MVDLPSGKMKSREGTVVEADDLITGMVEIAKQQTIELGKVSSMNETELENLYRVLGLGALKFYILKVNAKKRIMFNPEESIDFHGFTGPFIQYTYTRIRSILRKAGEVKTLNNIHYTLQPIERELLSVLYKAPEVLAESAKQYDPSVMANYVYSIAKTYNKFYGECPVLAAATEEEKECRIALSALTGRMIKHGLGLLGIEVPERM
jgi:arginyl-tRNA synthetase